MGSYFNIDTKIKTEMNLNQATNILVRKEILLPTNAGIELTDNQHFVEIWSNDKKIGWIYYSITEEVIQRIGYQNVGQSYVDSIYKKVSL